MMDINRSSINYKQEKAYNETEKDVVNGLSNYSYTDISRCPVDEDMFPVSDGRGVMF